MPKGKTFLLVAVAVYFMGTITVSALIPDNVNVSGSKIVTNGINNAAKDQAEMLKNLGLFIGTNEGFELHRHLTRAEAATLIVRFMGEEKNALAQKNKHPFKDVPAWADHYVGWLYKNKVTYGIGATRYGSAQNVTYWQFATMLSRISLGCDDFISSGVGTEAERSFIDRDNQDSPGTDFFRADAVSMMVRFMRCDYHKDRKELITVAQYLIRKGVFTAEQFVKAGIKVYPVNYARTEGGKLAAFLVGVPFIESTLGDIVGDTSYPATDTRHFYAWKSEDEKTVLYRMDCLTLEESQVAHWTKEEVPKPQDIAYFTTFGGKSSSGKDFLGVWHEKGVTLVTSDGAEAEIIAAGKDFGIDSKHYKEPYLLDGGKLVVTVDSTVYVFTKNGVTSRILETGTIFIGTENGLAVLYSERNGFGMIQGVRLDDWTVTDTYKVPVLDKDAAKYWPPENHPMIRQHHGEPYDEKGGPGIYGEAGLFTVREGRLERVTSRPVLDLAFLRIGAGGAHAILSHEPGTPPLGDTIYQYNGPMLTGESGYAEIERLGNNPPHDILISGIEGKDSMVFFYSRVGVGMGSYDEFTYYPFHNPEEDHTGIVVTSFTAGRPEISFYEHDARRYVQMEQERLNELGYKPY